MSHVPSEETFEDADGFKIFFRSWRPEGQARAVVVICHGVNSHGGQYLWTGDQLVHNDFAVYAIDLRGRGKSEGERFYIDDVSDYVQDVAALVKLAKAREPGLPVFLLGHSAGGVVSCVYALENQAELTGLICESFAFKVPAPVRAGDALPPDQPHPHGQARSRSRPHRDAAGDGHLTQKGERPPGSAERAPFAP